MSLRELRLKRGLTQQQLGNKVGMTQGRIADFEAGRRSVGNMTLDSALAICDALRVSNPRKLLEDSSPKENNAE
ncbi:helix-turn-helix transcriptional regulator [Bifidobacterium myosotis]|uniref:XRE family transcriptional regulator n=1 Tax=Bifidobacterium myosotis TaxID=1630166 RepID=A0A5M9ZI24_9BIFI|nr:helix-turn-helix transcriptional regulator [Bifidobacterium myosotis]KAA8827236.1 XRE family transcriptional regulator [Bifidobacterium myosotis]